MNYVSSQSKAQGQGDQSPGGQDSSTTSAYTCSSEDSVTISNYPHSIDKIIQATIGSEIPDSSSYPSTSSIIQIRELTQGLTIYNNKFTNNVGDTGTNLFLHNFENTESKIYCYRYLLAYPIIIEKNTFEGNLATQFASSFAIINYARDYVTMECKGIYVNENTFTKNVGCPYLKGTALIVCIPEKPFLSSVLQGDATESTDWVNYYVSTNQLLPSAGPRSNYNDDCDITTKNVFLEAMIYKTDNKGKQPKLKFYVR